MDLFGTPTPYAKKGPNKAKLSTIWTFFWDGGGYLEPYDVMTAQKLLLKQPKRLSFCKLFGGPGIWICSRRCTYRRDSRNLSPTGAMRFKGSQLPEPSVANPALDSEPDINPLTACFTLPRSTPLLCYKPWDQVDWPRRVAFVKKADGVLWQGGVG